MKMVKKDNIKWIYSVLYIFINFWQEDQIVNNQINQLLIDYNYGYQIQ